MKKIYIVIFLLYAGILTTWGQGIHFVHSYKEALEIANKENKRVFIDFYTQWCGPCKVMDKEIFVNPNVGEYFTQHFVSLKQDAETPEGKQLAKKFNVSSFPTYVFLNQQGNIIGKDEGVKDGNALINLAKNCMDSSMIEITALRELYENGEMDQTEILKYIELLRKSKLSALQPLESWMKMLKEEELYSEKTLGVIRKENLTSNDYPLNFLTAHYERYAKVVDKFQLDLFLYKNYIFECYQNTWLKIDNEPILQKLEKENIYFVPALREELELVLTLLKDPNRTDEFIVRTRKLVSNYPICCSSIAHETLKYAYGSRSQLEKYMDELAEQIAAYSRKEAVLVALAYVNIYLMNQDFEKAYIWVNHYIEWSGDPEYRKDLTLYIKRTLGLEKCAGYGKKMYNFKLPDLKGKQVSLSSFRGKYVLLDFWASWCGPCKGELPYLKTITEKYKKKGLIVISITCDKNDEDWKKTVEKEGMNWVHLSAKNTDINKQYQIEGIPRIMLLDKEGKLMADELRGKNIEKIIQKEIKL